MEKSISKNQNELIILILSGKNFKERREVQRKTWLKDTHIPYYFILGEKDPDLKEDNILWVNTKDDELARKVILAYRDTLKNYDFSHIFTCDDDTYVVIQRLITCNYENHMYMGTGYTFSEGKRKGKKHAEGGAGFFLSQEAVKRITQCPIDHEILNNPSDIAIGDLAKMYDIKFHNDNRFIQGYSEKKTHGEFPTPFNNKITSHYVNQRLFYKIYSQFTHLYWKDKLYKHLRQRKIKTLI